MAKYDYVSIIFYNSDVDLTRHAKYFKQTQYGVLTRMAILSLIFDAVN